MHPYRTTLRSICFRFWLAAAVALAPSAAVVSQEVARRTQAAAGKLDLRYATREAFAGVIARPKQVLTAPEMALLPYEVVQAAGQQELGIDSLEIEELQIFMEPPMAGPPQFLAVVRFAAPFRLAQLKEQVTQHAEQVELDGRPYLRSASSEPSFFAPDDRTLLIGSDEMLKRAYAGREQVTDSPLIERLTRMDARHDLLAAVEFGPVRPLINAQLQQLPPLPPDLEPFREAPNLIEAAEASFRLAGVPSIDLSCYATDEQAAEKLQELVEKALDLWQQQMLAAFAEAQQSDDAIQQAMGRYMQRVSGNMTEIYKPVRDGNRLVFFGGDDAGQGEHSTQMVQVATIGILVALLLPAVQAAREAARRTQSMNNMKQLMLALLNYEAANGHFPPHAIYGENGEPLLSWRVLILPYLEEANLYGQFHLDEPWDSEHNRQLIEKMPAVFADPSSPRALAEHRSSYAAPYGKGLFMEGDVALRIVGFADGTSRTIALVEVDDEQAPIWTQPQDIEVDLNQPAVGLGGKHPGIFLAAYCDGSVHAISQDIAVAVLRSMFTRAGGEDTQP